MTAPNTSSPGYPARKEWARERRTVYGDDLDKVAETVSADPAAYAATAEIAQAAAELGDYWRQLGRELRAANQAALAVCPLHGHRARRRASIHAILAERDRLPAADKAVVERADALKDHRKLIHDAAEHLRAGRLRPWTVIHAERRMPRDACPTWRSIISRWRAAAETAAVDYAETVQQRPVDDTAWRREIARRLEIEAARLNGRVRRRP